MNGCSAYIFSPKYWDEPYFIRHQAQQGCGNAVSKLPDQKEQRGVAPSNPQNLQSKCDLYWLSDDIRYGYLLEEEK